MKTIPWPCGKCGALNMVDILNLEGRQADSVRTEIGFVCEKCSGWQILGYTSRSLQEAEGKLRRYDPSQAQYQFLLKKLIHKATGMARKVSA